MGVFRMTNAELIKGLRWCADESICFDDFSGEKCPYFDEKKDSCSVDEILHAAADALEAAEKCIKELEAQNAELVTKCNQLQAQMPKRGEWKWLSSTYDRVPREMRYWCSVCHHEEITHNDKPWKHYCPNCGARMRGEQDE
jgi:hypothetical protein